MFKLIAVDFSVSSSRNPSRKLENSLEKLWSTFNDKMRDNNRIVFLLHFRQKRVLLSLPFKKLCEDQIKTERTSQNFFFFFL